MERVHDIRSGSEFSRLEPNNGSKRAVLFFREQPPREPLRESTGRELATANTAQASVFGSVL